MRIYIIGFMGCGKTADGKRLAKRLDFDFYDTDELFENKYYISVSDFFKKYDENLFRKLERTILNSTFKLENAIISTGGGTPCFFDNMEMINKHGLSVYMELHPKSLSHRLFASKKSRPLLKANTAEECENFVNNIFSKREYYYKQANIIVKGEDLSMDYFEKLIRKEIEND